jgi:DNA-binding response OmpR family regulator
LLRRRQGAGEAAGSGKGVAGGTGSGGTGSETGSGGTGSGTTGSGEKVGGETGAGTGSGTTENPALVADAVKTHKIIEFRELVIDKDKRKVTMRGERLELTPKEFDLLWLLAEHPGKTFSRHELLELIWGFAFQEYEHTVTSHMNRLRIKIEPNLNKPEYILTTWGAGYRFAE